MEWVTSDAKITPFGLDGAQGKKWNSDLLAMGKELHEPCLFFSPGSLSVMKTAMKTVVLLGDVGSGKSSLTEKVTGHTGLSSKAAKSYTRETRCFPSPDGTLLVLDTPGMNSSDDSFAHNVWVAQALSYKKVSVIAVVVRADFKIDNVKDSIERKVSSLAEFSEVLTVVVTFMDQEREWTQEDCAAEVQDAFGLNCIFVQPDTQPAALCSAFLSQADAHPELDINIDHENFFQFFRLPARNIKILKTAKEQLGDFIKIIQQFRDQVDRWSEDRVDLVYEFHNWCMQFQLPHAQKTLSEIHNFTFVGNNAVQEATFVANMSNQMKEELESIRAMMLGNQTQNAQLSLCRRCPHCGEVWMKTEGCDGATICGEIPSQRDPRIEIFATFTFTYTGGQLGIRKSGQRSAGRTQNRLGGRRQYGCGARICWKDMAPVQAPGESRDQHRLSMTDVPLLPREAQAKFAEVYASALAGRRVVEVAPAEVRRVAQAPVRESQRARGRAASLRRPAPDVLGSGNASVVRELPQPAPGAACWAPEPQSASDAAYSARALPQRLGQREFPRVQKA